MGSSLQSGLSDTIDAMGPQTSGQTGGISGALSDQFATKDTTSFRTPGFNGQADGGAGRSTPKRTQPNNALGTPRQTSSLSNASLAPKVPKSKTNPVLQGPEGPMQDPLTGRYLRVNDFKPLKQPKPKRQISTFSDATRQRVKSAQAAANKPSRVQEVWSGPMAPKAQTKELSNTRPHVARAQNTKHAQTMELSAAKAEPRVQEVWSGPKAHLNKPKDTQDMFRAAQDKYQNKLHTHNASASPAPKKGRTLNAQERKRARGGNREVLDSQSASSGAHNDSYMTDDERKISRSGSAQAKVQRERDAIKKWENELRVVRGSDEKSTVALGQKLHALAQSDPDLINSMPEELQLFQKGYSDARYSNYMWKEAPDPSSPSYEADMRKYTKWVERRERDAVYKGQRKASSVFHGNAFKVPIAEKGKQIVSGVKATMGQPLSPNTTRNINKKLDHLSPPDAYKDMPGVALHRRFGKGLAYVAGDLIAAPFTEAGKTAERVALDGGSRQQQIKHARARGAFSFATTPLSRVGGGKVANWAGPRVRSWLGDGVKREGRDLLATGARNLAETGVDAGANMALDVAVERKRRKDKSRNQPQ
ncbi:hypothetical protein V5T82_11670 [Magnetovibrio sp. PR-2]|uniref:hypothetical protein n=1 Tax=Magnetovibrio sp. PR-2 TaxID=3120356 RepID=UPI002FCE61BB